MKIKACYASSDQGLQYGRKQFFLFCVWTGVLQREEAQLLDTMLMLHAEHGGGNNSTFTCRVLTSSGTDAYSAYASAIGSLKGPRHGGANIKVMHMLDDFKSNVKDWENEGQVADHMRKVLNKEANDGSGLIYGMGHAVYTLSDPRAVILNAKLLIWLRARISKLNSDFWILLKD